MGIPFQVSKVSSEKVDKIFTAFFGSQEQLTQDLEHKGHPWFQTQRSEMNDLGLLS